MTANFMFKKLTKLNIFGIFNERSWLRSQNETFSEIFKHREW